MTTNMHGNSPGVNTTIEKAAGAINTNGLNTVTNGSNSRSHGPVNQVQDGKAIADQITRLALAGHHVIKGDAGDFTVCKYGLTRHCGDFAELAALAQKLGVNHA